MFLAIQEAGKILLDASTRKKFDETLTLPTTTKKKMDQNM